MLTIVEQNVFFSSDSVSDAEEKPHKGPISMFNMKIILKFSADEKLALCELSLISNNISTIADLSEDLRKWLESEEETLFEGLHISFTEDMILFYWKHLCSNTIFSSFTEKLLLNMIFSLMCMQKKIIQHLECESCQDWSSHISTFFAVSHYESYMLTLQRTDAEWWGCSLVNNAIRVLCHETCHFMLLNTV